ncbi:MAG TPA: hypothetical protein VK573_11245 [Gemmatimonadales bacterium]|nr:hypothetical protein [Gemmatimonadales bacterium]
MLRRSLTRIGLLSFLGAVACSDGAGPKLPPCTAAGSNVTLPVVGAYLSFDPTGTAAGCLVFPAAGAADSAEFLLVPQLATGVPGRTSSFRLAGDTIRPAPVAPAFSAASLADLPPAEQFHRFLRLGDQERWRGLNPQVDMKAASPARSPAAPAGPPVFGSQRTFKVCATLTCSRFDNVTATVRALKSNVAIYVDNTAPVGLDSAALDTLATLFETRLYPTDTAAFGRESDIDTNSVVMVLMTPTVNKLVTSSACATSGFVAGFFFGADIDPAFQNDSRSNKGEMFYSIVADPAGTLSCAHSTTSVQRIVPVTFIHEFQHMISFNQHVLLRGGSGEVLWLNEGFSHYAEELGGRTYAPGTPEFSRFTIGDLYNAYQFLDSTGKHFLLPTAGIGSLAERGAAWLFVRYLVDQYAADTTVASWNVFTRQMLATSDVGAANIANRTGDTFTGVVTRWAMANWVSDLPGFVAPNQLKYRSWAFRTTYASLNAQDASTFPKAFPLTPISSAGRAVNLSGTLRAGSGVYARALQAPSAPGFTLLFSTSAGGPLDPTLVPRLNVIRIR